MLFHFVDRIYEYTPFRSIRGLKNVTRNEEFFYWLPDGRRVLSPAVVTEALCQLGAWLKIASTDFKRRPVLLADEKTEYPGMAEVGDQIELEVSVLDFGDDVVVTRGSASVRGRTIMEGHCARGYLLPTAEFDDPARVRRHFENLYKPGTGGTPLPSAPGMALKPVAGSRNFDALKYVDGVIEHQPYKKVTGFKNFSSCEPFFETHFPLKPCVPGVLLLTFIGEISQYLVKDELFAPVRSKVVIPTFIENVRFRKFVEPGDQCILEVKVVAGDASIHNSDIRVRATIIANDTRVMQADMGLRTMFARDLARDPVHGASRKESA